MFRSGGRLHFSLNSRNVETSYNFINIFHRRPSFAICTSMSYSPLSRTIPWKIPPFSIKFKGVSNL